MNQLLAMRAFVRVVETGSFTKAAEQLALPRSTVSKLIMDLERHLGITVMHRTTRTVTTTSEGGEYYEQAIRLLAEIDEVDDAVRGKTSQPRGHLRIDMPGAFANCMLIPVLPDFHRQYPDVTIALGISDRTLNIVEEGVDCVIRAGTLQEMTMIGRKITDFDYVTCASPSYLQLRGMPSSPQDLKNRHLRVGYFSAMTGKQEPMVFEHGKERHEIIECKFSTNEGNGLIKLMLAGLGVGQHLRCFVQPYIDSGRLVEVLPDWTRPVLPLHAVFPPSRYQSARLKVFINWLIDTFQR